MQKKCVTVALCSLNREAELSQTLASLKKVAVPSDWRVEILLVDNGSSDGTRGVMEAFSHDYATTKILYEDKTGLSHARNRAVSEAKGEAILFTDDDVRFPIDWIEHMASPILDGGADAVAGGVKLVDHLRREWMNRMHRAYLACTDGINAENPGRLVGANMAFRKSALESIGLFDPALGAGALGFAEDTLAAYQLKKSGYRIVGRLDVAVEHWPQESRLSRSAYLQSAKKMGQSEADIFAHWKKKRISSPKLHAGITLLSLKLMCLRVWHVRQCSAAEGAPEWELRLLRTISKAKRLLIEQRQLNSGTNNR